jgi:hypothetical protein
VFVERRDFEYYLANLQEWKQVYELEVFSYCLMMNHVHLVVQANDNVTAIPQLMKRLAGRQTRFVNTLVENKSVPVLPVSRFSLSRFSHCALVGRRLSGCLRPLPVPGGSGQNLAAVHHQRLAGYPPGQVGGQE